MSFAESIGLLFQATADTSDAQRGLRDTGAEIGKVTTLIVGIEGALRLMSRALTVVKGLTTENVRASLEQERVFRRLNRTLEATNNRYDENSERLTRYLADIQATTRFGDDVVADVMAQVAQATSALEPSMNQLEDWTRLSLDLAEATDGNVAGAARKLSQIAAGNVEMLNRLAPAYRDVIREIALIPDASERARLGLEILRDEFSGAATDIDPLDLQLSRIQNGFGDVREAMGDLVRQNPAVVAGFEHIADAIDLIAMAADPASDQMRGVGRAVQSAAEVGLGAMQLFAEGFFRILEGMQAVRSGLDIGGASFQQANASNAAALLRDNYRPDLEARTVAAPRDGGRIRVRVLRQAMLASPALGREARRVLDAETMSPSEVNTLINALEDFAGQAQNAVSLSQTEFDEAMADIRAIQSALERGTGPTASDALDAALARLGFGDGESGAIGGGGGAATGAGGGGSASEPGLLGGFVRGDVSRSIRLRRAERQRDDVEALGGQFRQAGAEVLGSMTPEPFDAIRDSVFGIVDGFERMADVGATMMDPTIEGVLETRERMLEMREIQSGLVTELQTGFGDTVGGAMLEMSDGIISGGLAFDELAGNALESLSRMARGLGATYIAAGIPLMIPGPLFNPAAGGAYLGYGALLLGGGTILGMVSGGGGGGGGAGLAGARASTGISDQRRRDSQSAGTMNVLAIDQVITRDESTFRNLNWRLEEQRILGGGRL